MNDPTTNDPAMSELSLLEVLTRITNALSAELRAVASEHDLKEVQLQALLYLARCNHYSDTPAALTAFLGVTRGTVSQTLKTLERKALITKSRDQVDGRVVRCALTLEGRALVRASHPLALEKLDNQGFTAPLVGLLAAIQRNRGGRMFGVCATCDHHQSTKQGQRCGLTGEALSFELRGKICHEHIVGV